MVTIRLLELAWLMLPAYAANMAPPFVRFWRGWNPPIDAKWLGTHKTVLGFSLGVCAGVAIAWLQSRVDWPDTAWPRSQWFMGGLAMGFGAMAGDTCKSLLKRRLGIAPGKPWIPMDQLDFALGGLVMLSLWIQLQWLDFVAVLIFTFLGDILVNQISFRLSIRDTAW